jgi:hypothetical protein
MALYSRFAVQRMSLIALDQGCGGKFVLQDTLSVGLVGHLAVPQVSHRVGK